MAHPDAKLWRSIQMDGSPCILPHPIPDAIAAQVEALGFRRVAEPTLKWQEPTRGPDSVANTEGRWVSTDVPDLEPFNPPRAKAMTAREKAALIADLRANGDLPEDNT